MRLEDAIQSRIARTESLEQLAELMANFLASDLSIGAGGSLNSTRARVDAVGRLVLHVFPRDHRPPHFHVIAPQINARFSLDTCEHLDGSLTGRDREKIEWLFHNGAATKLREAWTRMHGVGAF